MNENKNMVCDLETGVCGVAEENEMEWIHFNQSRKKITLYYVTDPICSHCWALEPVLRRFVEQYGQYFTMHTMMGGLLESWNGFADVKNGISNPSDVAAHWREVGEYSRMPIDGSLWLTNPVWSSYPPSRVFKLIQNIDSGLANSFLRSIREAVFAFNQNIAEEEVLVDIVNQLSLNGNEIVKQSFSSNAKELLEQDFDLVGNLGVRGFPTIIMVNAEHKGVKIVGARSLQDYVNGLKQVLDVGELLPKQQPPLSSLLEKEKRLFSKEIEVMYDVERADVNDFIEKELLLGSYQVKEILGESYLIKN
ncbi:DsbA family protein [Ectobacillus funiculus]|uniref:DsbA family protein n=1 Tax=Ectobacillus funiculus TaxID=137993 RepID=A0ABV5WK51_9BACI